MCDRPIITIKPKREKLKHQFYSYIQCFKYQSKQNITSFLSHMEAEGIESIT